MKKYILTAVFAATCLVASAQVGVGTINPQVTLDVVGSAGDTLGALNTIDGIAVPIVTDDMTSTSTSGTKISQLVYSTHTASTGFYYWNGTAWVSMTEGTGIFSYGPSGVTVDSQDSAQLDLSTTTSNHITLTNGTFLFTYTLILPDPATNAGRSMILDNSGNVASYNLGAYGQGGNQLVVTERVVEIVCTGTGWAIVTNI